MALVVVVAVLKVVVITVKLTVVVVVVVGLVSSKRFVERISTTWTGMLLRK